MAKRKLNDFSADDAGDEFIPTVKKIKVDTVDQPADTPKKKPVKKKAQKKPKTSGKETEKKPETSAPEKKSPKPIEEQPKIIEKETMPKPVPPQTIKPSLLDSSRRPEKAAEPPKKESPVKKQAEKKPKTQKTDTMCQLIGFSLGSAEFAVEIKNVQEINRTVEITSVPHTPPHLQGVINLRGKVIPVVNARIRFGMEDAEITPTTRIIILEVKKRILGFLVDAVSEVIRISESQIQPPPNMVSDIDLKYIKGVFRLNDRLFVLLDLNRLLASIEIRSDVGAEGIKV